jgi:SAM-dependent methyltransferase
MMTSSSPGPGGAKCRFCGTALRHTMVDLGMSPLCESFLAADQLDQAEPFYPLHVWICHECFLAQVQEYVRPERIFDEYAYFSSYSDSWLAHARGYVETITGRLGLDGRSRVAEVGSNDGYLLQYFVARGIPAFGIEPAANVAAAAVARGVPTAVTMLGRDTARAIAAERGRVDLLIGNNVLAQVNDLNGFVDGLRLLLAPSGVLTLEFPHLARLIEDNQFDTIYHEHFSYFSLVTVERILAAQELVVFDVEELPTHGGSLRIYARHAADTGRPVGERVARLRAREEAEGFTGLARYAAFTEQVHETKRRLLEFLIGARRAGHTIAGYGAPGKGNTLLNFCGIRTDFLDYTVDRNPYKHGRFLPGTHIPIFPPERIQETRPDYLLILPWNLKDEIIAQMAVIRTWGGRFVVPIPTVTVYP